MSRIFGLPTELSDHIFSYLSIGDQKRCRLVCRQWYQQLSSAHFLKATTTLRLTPSLLANWPTGDLERTARMGKFCCIEVTDWAPGTRTEAIEHMRRLLEASQCSLEELHLRTCPEGAMRAVVATIGKMRRLQHLRVDLYEYMNVYPLANALQAQYSLSKSVQLAGVTHLEMCLLDESCLELVDSLAHQLSSLTLTTFEKHLLVRCLNEIHMPVLDSLIVAKSKRVPHVFPITPIRPADLGDGFWRLMAQLKTLRCTQARWFSLVLPRMLQHGANLECLAIANCLLSSQCVEQMAALRKLKDLRLDLVYGINNSKREPPALNLPALKCIHLSSISGIRLGERLPNLTTVVIKGPQTSSYPRAILSQLNNICKISGQRFGILRFTIAKLDREVNDWLKSLPVDLLAFEYCYIDGSLLDILTKPKTHRSIYRIEMHYCTLSLSQRKRYRVCHVVDLRDRFPYVRIADVGTQYSLRRGQQS